MKDRENNLNQIAWICSILIFVAITMRSPLKGESASFEPSPNDYFYYYKNRKIHLTLSRDEVAIKFKKGVHRVIRENVIAPMSSDLEDISKSVDLHDNISLLRTKKGAQAESVINALSALKKRTEVNYANPVFVTPDARMILTDEFIVKYRNDLTEEQIDRINNELGGIKVKKAKWKKNTYILRVPETSGLNSLDMSNMYHQRAGIDYVHPNFIRILKKLPLPDEGNVQVQDGVTPLIEEVINGSMDASEITWEPASLQLPESAPSQEGTFETDGEVGILASSSSILTEGFEGTFPGPWTRYGTPTWDVETYNPYIDSKSVWCAGSTLDPATQNHANNMNAWMLYGPFDLRDAQTAYLRFYVWTQTENSNDSFFWGVSTNGSNFNGYRISGNWAGKVGGSGWMRVCLYLNDFLGDLYNKSQVWIAFNFRSNDSIAYKGTFVDDVVIEKFSGLEPITTDPYSSLQWALKNVGQSRGLIDADIHADVAWKISHGDPNIIIAIIDEGVDWTHPDLAGKLVPVSDWYDATDGDNDPTPNSWDAHGTACAGIAAAVTDNAQGIAGVAWEAKIMPVRIGYSPVKGAGWITSDEWIANGITFAAEHRARVLSNSWGGGAPSYAITDAIMNAVNKGCVVVCASGNENSSVSFPAMLSGFINGVIAVGASTQCDERKSYLTCDGEYWWASNYGPELNVCAPGVRINTCDNVGSGGYGAGDYVANFNGTSAATPHVAGLAALVLGVNPGLSPSEVRDLIQYNADDLGPSGPDYETGYGRINAYQTIMAAQPLSISVSPDNWDIGNVTEGFVTTTWTSSTSAGGGYFYAFNNGGPKASLTISISGSASWVPGPVPGDNIFSIGHGQTVIQGEEPCYTNITVGETALTNDLGPGESYYFDLQFKAPASTDAGGIEQSFVLTITASP